MGTIFMNSENSKTSRSHVLILKLTDKLELRRGKKSVTLSNLSICYTWKNIKSSYKNLKYQLQHRMMNLNYQVDHTLYQIRRHSVLSPWDQEGMIFVSSARQGGQLLNSRARVETHSGGKMILGSQAGGDCFIMTNCWYFHKILHLEFYKFRLRRYLIFF